MSVDDIIIIRRGKDIFGNPVVLYKRKGELDLKRIKIIENINIEKKKD